MPAPRPLLQLHTDPGVAVVIALDAFPGAGALWRAPAAPAGCTLVEGDRRAPPAGGGAGAGAGGIGGPVQQRFEFTAAQPGRYLFDFSFGQPWSPEVRALQPVCVLVG